MEISEEQLFVLNKNNKFNQDDFDLNDKYLRLKKKSIRKLISLPPKYLGNLSKGIEDAIFRANQEIFNEFDGIPIAIGKKTLLQNVGTSIDDHTFIQFYVDLECIVFSPKIGRKVKAVVNKIGETYLGCLICDRINATIFKKAVKNNKNTFENIQNEEEYFDNLEKLNIGDKILIKIKNLKQDQNNLFITATFEKLI